MIDIEPIPAPAPLHLGYIPGRSRRLVLSFAGVGYGTEVVPRGEFPRLASCDGENHVLLIADEQRSWMNADGLVEALDAAIAALKARIQPDRIVAIGNSMGGSSALIYTDHAGIDGAMAFVPQYSVCRSVMRRGNNWRHYTDRIKNWRFPAVPELSGKGKDVVILHGGNRFELLHAKRFGVHEDILHRIFPKDRHQLAVRLKEENQLQGMVAAFARGEMSEVSRLLNEAGSVPLNEYLAILAHKARKRASRAARISAKSANLPATLVANPMNEAQHDPI